MRWTSLVCLMALVQAGCSCSDDEGRLDGATSPPDGATAQLDGASVGHDSAPNHRDAHSSRPDPAEDCTEIAAVVRDFDPDTHPDFENENPGHVRGLVMNTLGADHMPVYAHGDESRGGIASADSFAQWYRDVEGVNMRFEIGLPLSEVSAGRFVYDNDFFFPLDGMGFGNSGRDRDGVERNFHFTTEIHTSFVYEGGETFTFRGDDDLWLFIGGELAIDLGGVHGAIEETVNLDELGLTVGERYSMDIFHAERHTQASNFRIETTIACFMDPILI